MDRESNIYYHYHYESILNEGFIGLLKGFSHSFLERKLPREFNPQNILEVGSGVGVHRQYVKQSYKNYLQTDIRPNHKLGIIYADAESLKNFADSSVDRVIATCLIAHLANPKQALSEWRRVTKDDGIISVYVPCEPGFLLRLLRFFSTNIKGKQKGIDHYTFHYTEHRNYYLHLKYIFTNIFKNDKVSIDKFPFPFLSWNFNFFVIYTIRVCKDDQ